MNAENANTTPSNNVSQTAEVVGTAPNVTPVPTSIQEMLDLAASKEVLKASQGTTPQEPSQDPQVSPQVIDPAVKVEQPTKVPSASKRLLDIQRRDQELRRRERELEARERALPKQETKEPKKEHAPQTFTVEQLRRMAQRDPARFIKELGGIDEKDVGDFFMQGGKHAPDKQLRFEVEDRIQPLVEELNAFKAERLQEQQRRAQAEEQQHWDTVHRLTTDILKAAPDSYELLLSIRTPEETAQVIRQYIVDDYRDQEERGIKPVLKPIDVAAQELEADLYALLTSVGGTKKLRSLAAGSGASETKPIVNPVDAAPGKDAPTQRFVASTTEDEDPLEAYARRLLEQEGQVVPKTSAPSKGVSIGQGHMQQIPDRNSDRQEEDLYRKALEDLRNGII